MNILKGRKPRNGVRDGKGKNKQRPPAFETSATQVPLRRLTKNDKAILNTSSWVSKSELRLEDKVSLADSKAAFLQGLVVFVGKVHFAEGTWVGVQLTGPSIGRGNCDGTYKGKKYFASVGNNNGVMAPITKINKRIGTNTGDPKADMALAKRKTEKSRMADLQFIDCLTQERALAMLKLDEERRKSRLSVFDKEETHITRLKQMRLAEIMSAREMEKEEDKPDPNAPNLKYSHPNAKLQECDLKLAEGLEMTQQNFCLSDPTLPDNPIVFASQAFLNMTGYNLNEILGKNCRFLQGKDTDKYAVYRVRLSIKEGADCHVCLANYRKDGSKFYNRLFMTALRCTKGRIKNYLGVQCEVSEEVAHRINQDERAKLEGDLSIARMNTTMDMSSRTYDDLCVEETATTMQSSVYYNELEEIGEDTPVCEFKQQNSNFNKNYLTVQSEASDEVALRIKMAEQRARSEGDRYDESGMGGRVKSESDLFHYGGGTQIEPRRSFGERDYIDDYAFDYAEEEDDDEDETDNEEEEEEEACGYETAEPNVNKGRLAPRRQSLIGNSDKKHDSYIADDGDLNTTESDDSSEISEVTTEVTATGNHQNMVTYNCGYETAEPNVKNKKNSAPRRQSLVANQRRASFITTDGEEEPEDEISEFTDDNDQQYMNNNKNKNNNIRRRHDCEEEDDDDDYTNEEEEEDGDAAAAAADVRPKRRTINVRNGGVLFNVKDLETYPALVYQPRSLPKKKRKKKLPVIIVLPGAGKNEEDVWNLANPLGEHAGLIPSRLASGNAPPDLVNNFIVIAPYSYKKRSFYEEPRSKLLQFMTWACKKHGGGSQGVDVDSIDPTRIFLFGFSDGATLGVELMTTRRFAGGVFAAFGFTGTLPKLALQRLRNLPIWVFHSADDEIFPVQCSDRLVQSLCDTNASNADNITNIIKYTRYDKDQEGFTGNVRGHSTGITASKLPKVYQWLLSI